MVRVTFSVPTIDCERCARSIRTGLFQVPGVQQVEVDVPNQRVAVAYDPDQTTAAAVREHLEQIGFGPGNGGEERQEPLAAPPEARAAPRPGDRAVWYALLAAGVALLALAGYVGYVLYPRFGLPAVEGAGLLLLATGAGIASFFSPCSFPLLVTLLARPPGVERQAAAGRVTIGKELAFASALALGAAAFLLLTGLVIALGGEALLAGVTFDSPVGRLIRAIVGPLLILLGLMQLGVLPFSLHGVEHLALPLMRAQARYRRATPMLGFGLLGFGYVLAGFG